MLPFEAIYDVDRDNANVEVAAAEMDSDLYKNPGPDLPVNTVVEVADREAKTAELASLLGTLVPAFAADLAFYLKKWLIADFCLKYSFKRVLLAVSGHKVASQLLS